MWGRSSPFVISLSDQERSALEAVVAKRRSEQRMVVRSRIVLLAADGWTNAGIAERMGIALNTVIKWRKRFFEEGLEGLTERKRPGRRPKFSPLGRDHGQGAGM